MKSNFEIQDQAMVAIQVLEDCFMDCVDNGMHASTDIGNILCLKGDCDPFHGHPGWAVGFIATRLINKGLLIKHKKGNSVYFYQP